MKSPLKVPFLFLFLSLKLAACGSSGRDVTEVKQYNLFVESEDPRVRSEINALSDRFNARACFKVLNYTDDRTQANSFIKIVPGLEAASCKDPEHKAKAGGDDCKVGWGQWIRQVYQKRPVNFSGGSASVTYVYSMNVELDQDYFYERMGSTDTAKSQQNFILFSHEVGHGVGLNHNLEDPQSWIAPSVSGEKDDGTPFFKDVRKAMGVDPDTSC